MKDWFISATLRKAEPHLQGYRVFHAANVAYHVPFDHKPAPVR